MNLEKGLNKTFSLILCLNLFVSCNQDKFEFQTGALYFDQDTLHFDTLIPNRLSSVRSFSIYNKSSENLVVPRVYVDSDDAELILSINGEPASSEAYRNLKILANDSILAFVQLRLNSKKEDSGKSNSVLSFSSNPPTEIVFSATPLPTTLFKYGDLLPQVLPAGNYHVVDSIMIPKASEVQILKGAKFFMGKDSKIIVKGRMKIQGSIDKPVSFESDRLDGRFGVKHFYRETAAIWQGIFVSEGGELEANYAQINNTRTGIDAYNAKFQVFNTKVYHSLIPIRGVKSNLQASNLILADYNAEAISVENSVVKFEHLTASRSNNKISEYLVQVKGDNSSFVCVNSIFVGPSFSGISLSGNSKISNSVLQSSVADRRIVNSKSYDLNNSLFIDQQNYDFRLSENSISRTVGDRANLNIEFSKYDFKQVYRFGSLTPDAGAFQYEAIP